MAHGASQSRTSIARRERPNKGEKREEPKVAADSGSGSESESDSDSSYDSEEERRRREERRKRREERLAAVAAKALREKEELVARLEGEKHSLERVLREREKEQAQQVLFVFHNFLLFFFLFIHCSIPRFTPSWR